MAERWPDTVVRAGVGGLNLGSLDAVPPTDWTRMINAYSPRVGETTGRPGQLALTDDSGTQVHSVGRLNSPARSIAFGAGFTTRLWGIDTNLFTGVSGALTLVDSGYSGQPLSLVESRPPNTTDAWMYIGDSVQMRKVRMDGLVLPIGLPAPGFGSLTSALDPVLTTVIQDFESGAAFSGFAGTGGVPTLTYPAAKNGQGLNIQTNPGSATGAYHNIAATSMLAFTGTVGGVLSTDDDLIHLWLKIDAPSKVSEVRIYLTANFTFDLATIPGAAGSSNTDAFMIAIRPSVWDSSLDQLEPIGRAVDRNITAIPGVIQDKRAAREDAGLPPLPDPTTDQEPAAGTWTEYGTLDLPLRKADFLRIGTDPTFGWTVITGMTIVVQTADASVVNVTVDQMYLQGGYAPDASGSENRAYDYRYIHYDPRTGAKSNPSPVQVEAAWVSPLRGSVTLTPTAAGDAALRQWIYRRGGSAATTQDWFFVAETTADGAAFVDTLSDATVLTAGALDIDNDQPITTLNEDGVTIPAVPLPVLFGPIQEQLFGLGDPYRPGYLYWSKAGQYDHWPSANAYEVCGPSEQLMTGLIFGSQGYCWSRHNLYAIYPDLSGGNQLVAMPTACRRGIAGRWAACVGPDGLYGVDAHGVYRTSGGPPEDLTNPQLYALFHGKAVNGLQPVNIAGAEARVRLSCHQNEIWLLCTDLIGDPQVFVYNLIRKQWRFYVFGTSVALAHPEVESGAETLILGGLTSGRAYTHEGVLDDGAGITTTLRTAALDLGYPRQTKQLGDLFLDISRPDTDVVVTVTPYLNNETEALTPLVLSGFPDRPRHIPPEPFGTTPREALTVSCELQWTTSGPFTRPPVFRQLGISYLPLPDTTVTRATDWEDLGTPESKVLKGMSATIDTQGIVKTVLVEATLDDGSIVVVDTLTLQTTGRRVTTRSWPGIRATLFRLRPTDSGEWQVHDLQWIVDLDALGRTRWEGLPTDHGIAGWQTPLWAEIAIRSAASVTVELSVWDPKHRVQVQTMTLGSTGGTKLVQYLSTILAVKGVLFQWVLSSPQPFWVYAKECRVWVQPWEGDPVAVPALGIPDLHDPADMNLPAPRELT